MTATDTIRAMLDERGVEWRGGLPTETMVEADGLDLLYVALQDGRVRAFIRNHLTPEQAIEATLGSDLEAENAKLRELVAGIGHLLFSLNVDYCAACPRDGVNRPCPVHTVCGGECLYKTDLRELGVEV